MSKKLSAEILRKAVADLRAADSELNDADAMQERAQEKYNDLDQRLAMLIGDRKSVVVEVDGELLQISMDRNGGIAISAIEVIK